MVYNFSKRSKRAPTWFELKHSILRNFGGLDNLKSLEAFENHLQNVDKKAPRRSEDPDCTPAGLINACLFGDGLKDIERWLNVSMIILKSEDLLRILIFQWKSLLVDPDRELCCSQNPAAKISEDWKCTIHLRKQFPERPRIHTGTWLKIRMSFSKDIKSGFWSGLPQHQPHQDLHGNRSDGCAHELGKSLWVALRRPQPS